MQVEPTAQRPLTRRELREMERAAERARAAEALAAEEGAAASVTAQRAEQPEEPTFLTRRERREAERVAALAAQTKLIEEAQAAAAVAVASNSELFAAAVEIEPVKVNPVATVAAAPKVAPIEVAEVVAPAEVVAEASRSKFDVPLAPADEPKIEFASAFVRSGAEFKTGRVRRTGMRRASTAGRFGGSMVALSFLAGTVVLGAGSAAALNAIGEAEAEPQADEAAVETEAPVASQTLEVASDSSMSSTSRGVDATAVTSIGSAHTANLASGVSRPSSSTFTNNLNANVQWPFPEGVQMTDMYGPRSAPFGYAALSFHEGIDFTPGPGTPVGSMADGRVVKVNEGGSGYGVFVMVEHIIDGHKITTLYSHLQYGSVKVNEGDVINVGDELGRVGSTGYSTGNHLHFETRIDNRTVDPKYFLEKLNVAGIEVAVPESIGEVNEIPTEKVGTAESHALIDQTFGM